MFRIYNLAKRKKGVSPVIAVVLLIALTVAAAAVIWAITQGLIGGAAGAVSYNVTDTTSATATVRVEISITADATIASANLVNSTNTYLVDAINPTTLTANDEAIVTFSSTAAGIATGSYDLEITFTVDGNDQVETISVAFN